MKKWPSSRPVVQPSSPDESLYPSRISRTQINPKIPNELHSELMDFLGINRIFTLQDIVARGIRLALDEVKTARGVAVQPSSRPAVQPSSGRPVVSDDEQNNSADGTDVATRVHGSARGSIDRSDDQIDQMIDDVDQTSDISRPAVQPSSRDLTVELCFALTGSLSENAISTWFRPLKIELDQENKTVLLIAPNRVVSDWIKSNYAKQLHQALALREGWTYRWEIREETHYAKPETSVVAKIVTAAECKEDLLSFYSVVIDKPITDADIAAFDRVVDCAPESVRAGILRSRLKARGRVGSFAYCVPAIRQIEMSGLGRDLYYSLRAEVFEQPTLPTMGADVVNLNSQRKDRNGK